MGHHVNIACRGVYLSFRGQFYRHAPPGTILRTTSSPVRLQSCLRIPPIPTLPSLSNPQVTIFFIFIWFVIEQSTDAPQELRWRRLYSNSRAFISRCFELVYVPRRLAPLVGDLWLLLQSTWSGKQLGPGLVYLMLSIGTRQSGRLAKLILEHCKTVSQYKFRATTPFPRGIDPPCIAVADLDEVPQEVIAKGYSTQLDVHGLICMFMLFEICPLPDAQFFWIKTSLLS